MAEVSASPWVEPWPVTEDHKFWMTQDVQGWLYQMNADFGAYDDAVSFERVVGTDVDDRLQNLLFLVNRLRMTTADARAVQAASKSRSERVSHFKRTGVILGSEPKKSSVSHKISLDSGVHIDDVEEDEMEKVLREMEERRKEEEEQDDDYFNDESAEDEEHEHDADDVAAADSVLQPDLEEEAIAGDGGDKAAVVAKSDDAPNVSSSKLPIIDDTIEDPSAVIGTGKQSEEVPAAFAAAAGDGGDAHDSDGEIDLDDMDWDMEIPEMDVELISDRVAVVSAAPRRYTSPDVVSGLSSMGGGAVAPDENEGDSLTSSMKPALSSSASAGKRRHTETSSSSVPATVDMSTIFLAVNKLVSDMSLKSCLLARLMQAPSYTHVMVKAFCDALSKDPRYADGPDADDSFGTQLDAVMITAPCIQPMCPIHCGGVVGPSFSIPKPEEEAGPGWGAVAGGSGAAARGGAHVGGEHVEEKKLDEWEELTSDNRAYTYEEATEPPPPPLPYTGHAPVSMKKFSNLFYNPKQLCNVVLYPPKNGPKYVANLFRVPFSKLPATDWCDEMTAKDFETTRDTFKRKIGDLMATFGMAMEPTIVRSLCRNEGNKAAVVRELKLLTACIEPKDKGKLVADGQFTGDEYLAIAVGDSVQRGADWCWQQQDGGGPTFSGTVRALRQWHPADDACKCTSVVVMWDHGLYGNYRYGYRGAFDVRVTMKLDSYILPVGVGDTVQRAQRNWRWGKQDGGGTHSYGVVQSVHASVSALCGFRVAVLWDKDKMSWKHRAVEYERRQEKRRREEEKADGGSAEDCGFIGRGVDESRDTAESLKARMDAMVAFGRGDAHRYVPDTESAAGGCTKRLAHMQDGGESMQETVLKEPSRDWSEQNFCEVLRAPLPRYRWAIDDMFYDLKPPTATAARLSELSAGRYLMVGDTLEKTERFRQPTADCGNPNYDKNPRPVVLKVEQSDPKRVDARQIVGDCVYTTWCNRYALPFPRYGESPVRLRARHRMFRMVEARLKVGDRVSRGMFWDSALYGDEDGGVGHMGTVSAMCYALQTTAYIVTVKWLDNGHTNMYGWGYPLKLDGDPIYDLKRVDDARIKRLVTKRMKEKFS